MCIKYICANDMHKSGTRGICDISSVLFYKTHTQVQQLQLASLIFSVFDCAISGPCYLHSRLGPGMITGQINVCKHIFCSFTVRDPKAPVSAPKPSASGSLLQLIYILFWTCCQRIVGADESHLESPAPDITFVHSIHMYIYKKSETICRLYLLTNMLFFISPHLSIFLAAPYKPLRCELSQTWACQTCKMCHLQQDT